MCTMEYFIELSFKNVKFKREKYYIKKKKKRTNDQQIQNVSSVFSRKIRVKKSLKILFTHRIEIVCDPSSNKIEDDVKRWIVIFEF